MLKLVEHKGLPWQQAYQRNSYNRILPKKLNVNDRNGNASKEQVAKMLQSILNLKELPKNLDSTDGLAAAVCHFYNSNNLSAKSKGYSGWNFRKSCH